MTKKALMVYNHYNSGRRRKGLTGIDNKGTIMGAYFDSVGNRDFLAIPK